MLHFLGKVTVNLLPPPIDGRKCCGLAWKEDVSEEEVRRLLKALWVFFRMDIDEHIFPVDDGRKEVK